MADDEVYRGSSTETFIAHVWKGQQLQHVMKHYSYARIKAYQRLQGSQSLERIEQATQMDRSTKRGITF